MLNWYARFLIIFLLVAAPVSAQDFLINPYGTFGSGSGEPTPDIYWDATSGTTLTYYTDSSTVTLNSTTTQNSSGCLIDASDEWAEILYTPDAVSDMTIEIVVESTTSTPGSFAAFVVMGSNGADILLRNSSGGNLYHDYSDISSQGVSGTATADYWDQTEHTVRVIWSSVAGTATVYLDGVQDGQDTSLSWSSLTNASGPLYIGNRADSGWPFEGYIKSVKLWEQVVTP